ncbi:MAG TPA: proton-conducting transporter membrane subunit, partial [Dehalococcoidia bacterium]|nr:proton-conducting transporter membrane subunit [Dehalococcoidia bacterium]
AVIGLLGAVAASCLLLWSLRRNPSGTAVAMWHGGLIVDRFSLFVTITACVSALFTCLLAGTYVARIRTRSAGFFSLLLVATAGISALGAQHEMLTLFIALTLVLLSLTAIAMLLKTGSDSLRAGWAMFIEGGAALGLVLYGLALLYGATGTSDLSAVRAGVARGAAATTLGAALVVFGFTFALGIFPLHRWLARVARGVPAVPAAFIVVAAMTAGAVTLLRIDAAGLGAVLHPAIGLGTLLAAIALAAAAAAALRATRLSTLLAAGASAQGAVLFVAVVATSGAAESPAALLFAVVVFSLTILAAFGVAAMLQNAGLGDELADVRGLARRSPAAAVFLACALATLAGVPPLAGFVARLFIIIATMDAGLGWLAIILLAATVATGVPLVRVLASMWAEPGDEQPFTLLATPRLGRMAAAFCCLGAFYLTVLAEPLLFVARGAAGTVL